MSAPEVRTEPLNGGRLAAAAIDGDAPAEWYLPAPRGRAAWKQRAEQLRTGFGGGGWAAALREAVNPSGAAAERLDRCLAANGVVVTTGQQPGLFGGPLYTWSKALSAIAFADALQDATGMPVLPVFWAATDDSDFAEAATTYVAVRGGLRTLTMTPPLEAGAPLRDTPLGDVAPLLAELVAATGAAVYPDVLSQVTTAYSAGATVGGAYVALLRSLLEPLGMLVLDAGHPAVARAARPVLERALERSAPIAEALASREHEMRSSGFPPQVSTVRGLSLVFETSEGKRRRVPLEGGASAASGVLGPNVLLRPVVERQLLPTVAYLAGPAEIAYFAQVSAVAEALGVAQPLALPRWSARIIEPHIARLLDRLALDADELRDPHAAEGRLVRQRLPERALERIADFREQLEALRGSLEDALASPPSPPLLPPAVIEGASRTLAHRVDRLERRLVAAGKRRESELMTDIATARAALFPLGRPQERVLNAVPLLARHGPVLLDAMRARAGEHATALIAGRLATKR
ncbi:MAG: bacillithiol biosynthesis BshC [Gemmatimonadota bacterium]|nr:bacillithiol biosynthesis BshC [Gemmatimonadota bacterium]